MAPPLQRLAQFVKKSTPRKEKGGVELAEIVLFTLSEELRDEYRLSLVHRCLLGTHETILYGNHQNCSEVFTTATIAEH